MVPDPWTARRSGASFRNAKCVRACKVNFAIQLLREAAELLEASPKRRTRGARASRTEALARAAQLGLVML